MPPKFSKEIKERLAAGYRPKRQHRGSPCEAACPAGNRIQYMETLLKEGKRAEAKAALLSRNPFPGVTGRVCTHPCEAKCNRQHYDEAVYIQALERFAADSDEPCPLTPAPDTGKRIAIVGSGPAGMTAAFFLRLLGHEVEIFEAAPVLGGVPRTAIPDFRLPKDVPDKEAGFVLSLGVKAATNAKVGRDRSLEALLRDYDACLLAVGNGQERRLQIPGGEKALPAVEFLRESNLSRRNLQGLNVVIIGGGGVAFDSAFSAKRLGAASVQLVFPEAEDCIRAPAEEIAQAKEEGLTLHPSRLAVALEGGVLEALRLESFCFDEKGALQAETVESDRLRLQADLFICASGLMPDLSLLGEYAPERTPRGHLKVDERMETSLPGLFAAGDIVEGPSTVASAVGSGRRAALGVHARLSGLDSLPELVFQEDENKSACLAALEPGPAGEPHVVQFFEIQNPEYHEKAARRAQRRQPRGGLPFAEINTGLAPEDAEAEAARCMHCGHCINCGTCAERCPNYIIARDEEDGPWLEYPEECWHCACCRIGCPTGSISIEFPITMLV